jgi:hypothetical protein
LHGFDPGHASNAVIAGTWCRTNKHFVTPVTAQAGVLGKELMIARENAAVSAVQRGRVPFAAMRAARPRSPLDR